MSRKRKKRIEEPAPETARGTEGAPPSVPTAQPTRADAAPGRKPEEGQKHVSKAKKNDKPRRASEETVISRARQMVRAQNRKLWATLGLEGDFDEAKLAAAVEELAKQRVAGKTGAEPAKDGRVGELERELAATKTKLGDVEKKLSKAQAEVTAKAGELAKKTEELDNFVVEQEIREAARGVGFVDTDYGVDLFRRHLRGLPENEEPDVAKFFTGLREDPKKKHLFHQEDVVAGPKAASQVQQVQSQAQQGATQAVQKQQPATQEAQPKVQPASGAKEEPDAMSMSRGDFARHSADRYGYRPGMA